MGSPLALLLRIRFPESLLTLPVNYTWLIEDAAL